MLREASLRRLDLLLKNQKELQSLDDNGFICPSVKASDVIPSGLGIIIIIIIITINNHYY
jgi:hypothetical protein